MSGWTFKKYALGNVFAVCVSFWSAQLKGWERRKDKYAKKKNGDWFDFMVLGRAGAKREKVMQREQDSSASPMTGCSCVNGLPILVRYWERNMLPPTSAKQRPRLRTASDWSTSSTHGRFDVHAQGSPCHCVWKPSFSATPAHRLRCSWRSRCCHVLISEAWFRIKLPFEREPALKSCLIKLLLNNPHITGSLRNYRRLKWAQL